MKNQIKKVLSVVLVLAMCLSTFVIGVSAEETCVHDGKSAGQEYYGWQDPTCTEMGGHKYNCTICGKSYALETVAPLQHNVPTWNVKAPTCTEAGYTWGTCLNGDKCSEEDAIVKKDFVNATGHSLVTKDGDCKIKECENCDYTEESDANHNWVAQEADHTVPTCTGTGIMPYKCTECGATKDVVINAHGHKFNAVAEDAPNDCEDTGVKAHFTCEYCTNLFVKNDKGEYVVVTEADLVIAAGHLDVKEGTATITGCVKTTPRYCDFCKEDLEPKTEAAHSYIEDKTTEATCTTYGYIFYVCENCGHIDEAQTKVIPPKGHSFQEKDKDGNWVIKEGVTALGTIAATCLEGGATIYACTNAGCKETKEYDIEGTKVNGVAVNNVPALGHDWEETTPMVPAGCETDGATSVETCARCQETRGGNKIDAKGHAWGTKTYDVTCVHDGYTCQLCANCGEEKDITDRVVADGTAHSYIDVLVRDEDKPVCTDPGYWVKVCEHCGDKDAEKRYETVVGHKWDAGFVAVPGNCSDTAIITKTCTVCGAQQNFAGSKADPKEAQSHLDFLGEAGFAALTPIKTVRPASCTAPAYYAYKCTCGETFTVQGEWGHTLVDKFEEDGNRTDCFTGAIGYEGKWCTECNKWVGAAEGGVDKVAVEHELDATMAKKDFVCKSEIAGWKEFKYCSICAKRYENTITLEDTTGLDADQIKVLTNKYLAALAAAEETKIYHDYDKVEKQNATCTADGWNEYCSVCQKATDAGIKLVATGHDDKVVDYKTVDCVQIGYNHYVCANECGREYVDEYKFALGHTWEEVADAEVVPPTCEEGGYTEYECTVCDGTKREDPKPALGHKNAAGETLTTSCLDTAKDRVCATCGETIETEHSYKAADVYAPTCTALGYTIAICTVCEESTLTDYVDALGHNMVFVVETLAPTPTTDGAATWGCTRCEYTETRVVPATGLIQMGITAQSAIKDGLLTIVNGGLVEFTVKINVADLKAAALKAEFTFDASVLKFENAVFADDDFAAIFDVVNEAGEKVIETNKNFTDPTKVQVADDGTSTITIIVDASYTANKIPTDVERNGEYTLVKLYFRVAEDACTEDGTPVDSYLTGSVTEATNVAGEMFVTEATASEKTLDFKINKLGSINADKVINTIDLLAIRQMIITNLSDENVIDGEYLIDGVKVNYLAEADIDMDGEITLYDYARLNDYLVNTITYEALVLTSQTPVAE